MKRGPRHKLAVAARADRHCGLHDGRTPLECVLEPPRPEALPASQAAGVVDCGPTKQAWPCHSAHAAMRALSR
eukprot:scaffold97269_cov35-Phaeocystis_antarctica.AAC.3